jgi:hypothetical protein
MNNRIWIVAGIVGLASAALSTDAGADLPVSAPNVLSVKISLTCSYGASDVARVYSVRNNQTKPIKAGTRIHAESTLSGTYPNDKRPGSAVLAADLAPGQVTQVLVAGQTNAGSCTAHFFAGQADVTIESLAWTKVPLPNGKSVDGARVVVRNLNQWVNAGTSKTRVSSMACNEQPVETKDVDTPAIPAGGAKTVFVALSKAYPAAYLRAQANANNGFLELKKDNNTRIEGIGVCIH